MIFNEILEKEYNGNYRAEVIDIDKTKIKNGYYKIRIYPFYADVEDSKLPYAPSNMTNRLFSRTIKKGDYVWVFFEAGNLYAPVIFNFCNIKDKYPESCKGIAPSYYSSITPDTEINEETVSYNGEYNEFSAIDLENIKIDFDEKNKQIVIYSDKWYVVFSKDGNGHFKFDNVYLKGTATVNIKGGSSKIIIDDSGIKMLNASEAFIKGNKYAEDMTGFLTPISTITPGNEAANAVALGVIKSAAATLLGKINDQLSTKIFGE